MGYVGLPLTLLFSEQRFRVTGFDVDTAKVAALNSGGSYIVRIPAAEIVCAQAAGFRATAPTRKSPRWTPSSSASPLRSTSIISPISATSSRPPTPSPPTSARASSSCLRAPPIPAPPRKFSSPSSNPAIPTACAPSASTGESGFHVAFSPEREDPGNDTVARRDIPKVIGGLEPTATALASALYGTIFNRTVPVSSPATAEMTKLLENIYRCVNIALVNELKQLCDRMGIDIFEVIDAAKTKPFGFQAFYPGPGLGGHCIPIDPFYLSWKAKQFDFRTRFIELAGEVNNAMPYYVIEKTALALNRDKKCLNGSRILVLGLAYKRDIDDLRESPSLTIIELLRKAGAEVFYNDPFFPTVGRGRHYDLNMTCTPLDNLGQYDAVLIVTDHTAYDYRRIVAESQIVVDTRNATKGIAAPNIVHC